MRDGEPAEAYHERCHQGPVLDWPPGTLSFENCPGYPCRTYRYRGWMRERVVHVIVVLRRKFL